MIRIQSLVTELLNLVQIDHILQIIVIPNLNLLNLVRGAEAVEEVDERKLSVNCCAVSNRCQIHNLLNGALAEHGSTGLTTCIYVRMVTEDVQCMSSYAACRNVEYGRKTFACNLVDVRDHQKKSLGSGKGRGHGTCYDGAVCCTCSTCLGLHLGYVYNVSEDILASGSCPFVNVLRHNR